MKPNCNWNLIVTDRGRPISPIELSKNRDLCEDIGDQIFERMLVSGEARFRLKTLEWYIDLNSLSYHPADYNDLEVGDLETIGDSIRRGRFSGQITIDRLTEYTFYSSEGRELFNTTNEYAAEKFIRKCEDEWLTVVLDSDEPGEVIYTVYNDGEVSQNRKTSQKKRSSKRNTKRK